MSTPEQNVATLRELYENLGPGIDTLMRSARKAMTEDVVWLNVGFPTVNGLDELEGMCRLLEAAVGFHSNPILEWRNLWGCDHRVFFERKGSFADINGRTIIAFDVLGVYEFNDQGKIFSARDYFDNARGEQMLLEKFGRDKLAAIQAVCMHPLDEYFDPQLKPYSALPL